MLATSAQDPCLELHALLIPTACCRVSDPPLFLFLLLLVIQPPLQPPAKYLLPELTIADDGKKCVVIDLDETLVHSSFKVAERGGGPGRGCDRGPDLMFSKYPDRNVCYCKRYTSPPPSLMHSPDSLLAVFVFLCQIIQATAS